MEACGWLKGAVVHTLPSPEPGASSALMAAIIKKAFKEGCVMKGAKVGVVLLVSE